MAGMYRIAKRLYNMLTGPKGYSDYHAVGAILWVMQETPNQKILVLRH